jgi:DnaJ-class molecular chaperone
LGIAPGASLPTFKRAYRAELKRHHPDMFSTLNGAASPRFCPILNAFAILADPVARAECDAFLAERRQAKAASC